MAEQDIIQQRYFTEGQSQPQRLPQALTEHYIDIDEYSSEDLLRFMLKLAPHIHFYANGNAKTPAGNWQNFFPFNEDQLADWLAKLGDDTSPHLALIRSFIELYQHPQRSINTITAKHLAFYYHDVLQLQAKASSPDHAHVVVQLKKNAATTLVSTEHEMSAGKDATGVELIYKPVRDTLINQAQVMSLQSLYKPASSTAKLLYAPIANSADGIGSPVDTEKPQWHGFGQAELPNTDYGFAVSAPVLSMAEGERKITLTCSLTGNTQALSGKLNNAFKISLTTTSQWLDVDVKSITSTLNNNKLIVVISIASTDDAIVDYDADIHGYDYDAQAPVLKCTLNNETSHIGVGSFEGIQISQFKIDVDVSGIETLQLENDLGSLNSKKAFLPFGAEPKTGSRFFIGYDEALNKQLSSLTVNLSWLDAPEGINGFNSHYQHYASSIANSSFTVNSQFTDISGNSKTTTRHLFNTDNPNAEHSMALIDTPSQFVLFTPPLQLFLSLIHTKGIWAQTSINQWSLQNPGFAKAKPVPTKPGFITMTLKRDFLHQEYRQESIKSVLAYAKDWGNTDPPVVLNEPYTPTIQKISLSYKASSSDVTVNSSNLNDFANDNGRFYHLIATGQYREHSYLRHQFEFLSNKTVSFLPALAQRAALLIGLSPLSAGDSISLLFQIAEGSSDPDLLPLPVSWSVLCDNYWKKLSTEDIPLDRTQQLLKTGLIQFVIPQQATTENTLLPAGHIWLKAAIDGDLAAMPKLIDVISNAVEVVMTDNNNDPEHLATALAAESIAKLKTNLSAVKAVSQPYSGFSGAMAEHSDAFNTRVAERLRHKDRAISSWDYERLILQQFPIVHRAKVINHAKPGSWSAPGHVMAVVIADLNNHNAIDPLQPRMDSATIDSIAAHLKQRCGSQIEVHVRNPQYQQIKLSFKVKFHRGFAFNFYQQQLQQALLQKLSPWAFSSEDEIQFGGKIYKSVLIDFIEELDYVDYLSEVKLYSFLSTAEPYQDQNSVTPNTPDTILVSASSHDILEMEC